MKKMYTIAGECTISIRTIVEANSKREALKKARDRAMESIHGQGDQHNEWVTSGELDGVPEKLRIEED